MTPRLKVPGWALEAGMPAPAAGEDFHAYWGRMGAPMDAVLLALVGLNDQTVDHANDRMAQYVRTACPAAFDRHVTARFEHSR